METQEEREARLEQVRVYQQQRLATETQEEREARLEQLRVCQQQRLATETEEEREARLEQLRVCKQQRIASESPDETETRRQRDREGHTQQVPMASAKPLLHQEAVQWNHSGLEHLQVSMCITCCESFPAMTVRMTSSGSECVRCSRDRHNPKSYSCENNMHPGAVP